MPAVHYPEFRTRMRALEFNHAVICTRQPTGHFEEAHCSCNVRRVQLRDHGATLLASSTVPWAINAAYRVIGSQARAECSQTGRRQLSSPDFMLDALHTNNARSHRGSPGIPARAVLPAWASELTIEGCHRSRMGSANVNKRACAANVATRWRRLPGRLAASKRSVERYGRSVSGLRKCLVH